MGQRLAYLDAGAIIRYVEATDTIGRSVVQAIDGRSLATSVISLTECLTKPLRDNLRDIFEAYEVFFETDETSVLLVEWDIARLAADIRAERKLKTPHAIHLATAIVAKCEVFITADSGFERCRKFPGVPEILIVPAV